MNDRTILLAFSLSVMVLLAMALTLVGFFDAPWWLLLALPALPFGLFVAFAVIFTAGLLIQGMRP